jgi:hypothetical protein
MPETLEIPLLRCLAKDGVIKAVAPQYRRVEADPRNAGWQRDLWVGYWKVSTVLEKMGSATVNMYWRKAYEKLLAIKLSGAFVSEQDMAVLQFLRDKVGDR